MGLREDYKRHRQRGGRYQGKEFTTHFQANSEEELDEMIREAQRHSDRMGTGPVETIRKKRDPDGGWEAIVSAHNWNPLKWVKEKFAKRREGSGEEREYQRRRRLGGVPPEELSPREQREQIEAARKQAEEVARAAQRIREAERKRRTQTIRERGKASEEAQAAEERARVLETELYGKPLESPQEVIRDRWGKELYRQPLTAKRREEAAKLELAQKRITERGIGLIEERYKEAEETLRERRVAKRRRRVLGPAEAVAKGVAGTVEAVGRGVTGIGFRPEPYRMTPPSVIPTPRPAGPTISTRGLPAPRALDLSHLRDLQMRSPVIRQPSRPKGRNTYNEQMRKLRKMLFG